MPTAETNLQVEGAASAADPSGATATAAPGGSASPPAKPWYDGKLDAELLGHIDNKGWKRDDPIAVAVEATKAARELQRHFGVPETHLIKLPKDANDEAAWSDVYQRFGAPKEAKEYDLSNVKFSDGSPLAEIPGFEDAMRAVMYSAHVPKDKAAEIVKTAVKFVDSQEARAGAQTEAQKLENEQALRQNWGHNFEFNRLTALQGARRAGVTAEALQALDGAIGYANVMELFRKIGAFTNEDAWVAPGQGGHPVTKEGAIAHLAALKADKDGWAKRLLNGDAEARKELLNLQELIHGVVL